jgi:hypothetical protein
MADYTPNPWILDEIAANRKWMVEMMDGMPTECLTSCANEIESLRAELTKRTDERDEARRSCCEYAAIVDGADTTEGMESGRFYEIAMKYMKDRGWDCFKEDGK